MRFREFRMAALMVGLAMSSIACAPSDSQPGEEAVSAEAAAGKPAASRSTGSGAPAVRDREELSGSSFQFTIAVVPVGVVSTVFVQEGKAFARPVDSSEIDVVFDLVDYGWIDVATGRSMTYAEGLRRWGVARSRLLDRLRSLSAGSEKQAVEFLLDPAYTIEQEGDRVEFVNEFGSVTVDTVRPEDQGRVSAFHAYNRLSSIWLFATDRGLPDTMIEATSPHLEQLGLLPGRIASKPSPATGIAEHTIEFEYRPLDARVGETLRGFYETLRSQ